jgi:hypothetical protein
LLALCALTVPAFGRPVEDVLLGAARVWPERLLGWLAAPVEAAVDAATADRLAELEAELVQRVAAADFAGAPLAWLEGCTPVPCHVVAVERLGGGGEPCELRLDRSWEDLAGALPYVTKGPRLVGTLAPVRDQGARVAMQPARVQLLNHPAAHAHAGELQLDDGARLRLVARAAAAVDPAPLRVELWDDPHRAAGLDRMGQLVRTVELAGALAQPPEGLWLGHTLPWGYERADGERALAIGVYLVPPFRVRALASVVVWLPGRGRGVAPPRGTVDRPARLQPLPDGRGFAVAARGPLADGAAVLVDGWCLGRATAHAFGQGFVTPFRHSRDAWGLLLLPDDPARPVVELLGTVQGERDGAILVRWQGEPGGQGASGRLPPGHLFTGANGPHCPPGLLLGRAEPVALDAELLQVLVPAVPGAVAATVLVAAEGP